MFTYYICGSFLTTTFKRQECGTPGGGPRKPKLWGGSELQQTIASCLAPCWNLNVLTTGSVNQPITIAHIVHQHNDTIADGSYPTFH